MDIRNLYIAIRVLAIFIIGWMIGFKEPEKLLVAFICLTAVVYGTLMEAHINQTEALAKQRSELVKETYGSKV